MNYTLTLEQSVKWCELEGQTVLFSERTGDFYGLNQSGAVLIQKLLNSDFQSAVKQSSQLFNVAEEEISADLEGLVVDLIKAKLVTKKNV